MKKIVVDITMLDTKDKIHDFFFAELGCPRWYGRNLDALYDELTSVCEELCIECCGEEKNLPVCTKGMLDVLYDAAKENAYIIIQKK